jgi:hypothetical protein
MAVRYDRTFLDMSDEALQNAESGALSVRGTLDAYFEAGYLALLGACTRRERVVVDHPSTRLVAEGASRLGVDSKVGVRYATLKYSVGEELPTLDEVRSWTAQVRAAAGGGPLDNRR